MYATSKTELFVCIYIVMIKENAATLERKLQVCPRSLKVQDSMHKKRIEARCMVVVSHFNGEHACMLSIENH